MPFSVVIDVKTVTTSAVFVHLGPSRREYVEARGIVKTVDKKWLVYL